MVARLKAGQVCQVLQLQSVGGQWGCSVGHAATIVPIVIEEHQLSQADWQERHLLLHWDGALPLRCVDERQRLQAAQGSEAVCEARPTRQGIHSLQCLRQTAELGRAEQHVRSCVVIWMELDDMDVQAALPERLMLLPRERAAEDNLQRLV